MKWIAMLPLLAWPAAAQPEAKVTYFAEQASVQDVAKSIAAQAGLGYKWQKSFDQTDPDCRRYVFNLIIDRTPFEKAMAMILDPLGLRYEVEAGKVVLYRK